LFVIIDCQLLDHIHDMAVIFSTHSHELGRSNLDLNLALRNKIDNFRMNTGYGRYGATYNMVGLRCFNEELSLLPKNPTEAKLQATSTRGESTEPT
jgi:hypothetical protein